MTAAACAVDDRIEADLEPIGVVLARVIDILVVATAAIDPAQAARLALLAIELRREAAHGR